MPPRTLGDPATKAVAVTPSDSDNLTDNARGLYVGTGGDVSVEMVDVGVAIIFSSVQGGTILPIQVSRVNLTGTTASNIVALC